MGKKYTDLIANIMTRYLSDDLAAKYSYQGKQKKLQFNSTILDSSIISKYEIITKSLKLCVISTLLLQYCGNITMSYT